MLAVPAKSDLFERAPPRWVGQLLGLVAPHRSVWFRALLAALVAWSPLVLLTVAYGLLFNAAAIQSLTWEIGVHARYLIAVPLLVIADVTCAVRLNAVVREFVDSGIVADRQRGKFDAAVASTRALLASPSAEIAIIALAYLVVAATIYSHPDGAIPLWHKAGGWLFSPAGWWHVLVSLPLLVSLLLGWAWRLVLWTRLLWAVSRLDLRLVASHPDHSAGLLFVGRSVGAFSTIALALATIAAGRSAHIVLLGGTVPTENLYFNVGLLAAVLVVFTAPLLIFTPILLQTWQRGTLTYGALAKTVGAAFERKWLGPDKREEQSALDKPDFSTTTDLYSIVANVHAIRFIPLDIRDLITLAVATLIPFGPVVLLAVPADTILQSLKSLLL